jgi:hypothetical protein
MARAQRKEKRMENISFVTKNRRHRQETISVKELNARLDFLYLRVNSQNDPAIQSLIKRTKEALDAAERRLRETRIASLGL